MNGNRKILFVFACTLVIVSCSANAQQFSASSDYASFYAPRYNVKLDNEPTIAIWWLIEKFSDTDWSRQRLHDELIRFSERYPNSPEHVERAKWHVQTLARMLDEKRPPEEKRIERLIYDLREVNAIQFFQPSPKFTVVESARRYTVTNGKPLPKDIAARLRVNRNAAQILVDDVGYDAVPYLIDHLDDDTLTRSVHYWRDSVYSHNILTVGECCQQVLDCIIEPAMKFDFEGNPTAAKASMKAYYAQKVAAARKKAEQ